ncbi:hypothetical protein O1611_g52 [Lasiodiplodia mahajangana]|uniref:Uncharacterized protein n=1 Tax=Lasiodiplodia mahajangana TaxID=1108764 RepID=A0ACC2K1T8_9PEZI|nr:hypothetical protein O1611_g52 [Lasiodiplodia mahajangana]
MAAAMTMLSFEFRGPYSLPEWGKYLFTFSVPCVMMLAIVGLPFVGPGYPVHLSDQFGEASIPMSLLLDPKAAKAFTAMSVLVVIANPFLTLLAWLFVPLICLARREDGHWRGGIAISFYCFLNVVMVVVVILGEMVASTKPAFEEVLRRFPDLTLAEAQRNYNARIHGLRVGLAINFSVCLAISLVQIALVSFVTLIPSSMKVPRRYEPTIQGSAAHQREEEVPLLFSVMDNSSPVAGTIEELFQLHEARWMQSRRREEAAIHESLATNQTADNGSGDTEESNVSRTLENTYTGNTADGIHSYTPGEDTAIGREQSPTV